LYITVLNNLGSDNKSKRRCAECNTDIKSVLHIRFKFSEAYLCHDCAVLAVAHIQEAVHNMPGAKPEPVSRTASPPSSN